MQEYLHPSSPRPSDIAVGRYSRDRPGGLYSRRVKITFLSDSLTLKTPVKVLSNFILTFLAILGN